LSTGNTINVHWYSINESINYPIDDLADCITDQGNRLPSNILVDANIRWPSELGDVVFLSNITVNQNLVSLVFQTAPSIDSVPSPSVPFYPICVVNLRQPVIENRHYPVRPFRNNVGGWLVFGSGIRDQSFTGSFSAPKQSFLCPKAARPIRRLQTEEISTPHSEEVITGDIVYLKFNPPLYGRKGQVVIDSQQRDVIVIGLDEIISKGSSVAQAAIGAKEGEIQQGISSVYHLFSGPCGDRPESGTCRSGKTAIEFINGVGPDCNGEITIEFAGCAQIGKINNITSPTDPPTSVVLECDASSSELCPPPYLPDQDGILPAESTYTPPSFIFFDVTPPQDSEPTAPPNNDPPPSFPHLQCFTGCSINNFEIRSGQWTSVNLTSSSEIDQWRTRCESSPPPSQCIYQSLSLSLPNIYVWTADVDTADRYYETHFKMFLGSGGAKTNGGIIFNCRQKYNNPDKWVFHTVLADYEQQKLLLLFFNGNSFSTIHSTQLFNLQTNKWYQLGVQIKKITSPSTTFETHFQLKSLSDNSINVTVGPITLSNYFNPHVGKSGLFSLQAKTDFSYWFVDNQLPL